MPPETSADRVSAALFGATRRRVLGLLFSRPGESFYLREIVRLTGAGLGPVQRELASLVGAGLAVRRPSGHQVYFTANTESPVFRPLQDLVIRTVGVAEVVRNVLRPLYEEDRIHCAFLFGSVASGQVGPESDVDVLVVGRVSMMDLMEPAAAASASLGREVNPVIRSPEEFRKGSHFLDAVLAAPKVMLFGNDHDLARLAGKSVAPPPPTDQGGDGTPPEAG